AGYGNNKSATESQASRYRSRGEIKGYSIGSYATWYANRDAHTGAWLDSWLLYSWFDNEVKGQNLAAETYKSHGFTASLES
ncbi:autotransporter outer membrane beta-barrel domain-containing protein, partial [Pantoea agglomerans]|uniref:autotransporter outer membrane beta-barrel domain-containing protein n=1 Tax=Enterobacter agglomerans TaxID=549 RepID=UPI001A8C422A